MGPAAIVDSNGVGVLTEQRGDAVAVEEISFEVDWIMIDFDEVKAIDVSVPIEIPALVVGAVEIGEVAASRFEDVGI